MTTEIKVGCGRRRLLVTTAVIGGIAGVATAVPLVSSWLRLTKAHEQELLERLPKPFPSDSE